MQRCVLVCLHRICNNEQVLQCQFWLLQAILKEYSLIPYTYVAHVLSSVLHDNKDLRMMPFLLCSSMTTGSTICMKRNEKGENVKNFKQINKKESEMAKPESKTKKFSFRKAMLEFKLEANDILEIGSPLEKEVWARTFNEVELSRASRAKQRALKCNIESKIHPWMKEGTRLLESGQKLKTWRAVMTPTSYDMPQEIWEKVLKALCDDIEPNGVRSASVIARDISNASSTKKQLYIASKAAFEHLSTLCPPLKESLPFIAAKRPKFQCYKARLFTPFEAVEEQYWNKVIHDPASLSIGNLEVLCDYNGLPESECKETMIFRLASQFGVRYPTRIPAKLAGAVCARNTSMIAQWPLWSIKQLTRKSPPSLKK